MSLKNIAFSPLKNREDNYSSLISLQDRVNDMFENLFSDIRLTPSLNFSNKFPAINVNENTNAITIKAELPGVEENDVKIDVNKNKIIISGEKKSETNEEKSTYHIY